MNDPEQTTTWRRLPNGDIRDRLAAYDADFDVRPTVSDSSSSLVSLGFLGSALRRRARFWCIFGLVGLIIGAGYAKEKPPAYTAATTVLLVSNPLEDPNTRIFTDIALAQSTPVASAVVNQLGLQQTPASFVGTYTVTQVTPQILSITAKGPNFNSAMQRASAVATQYLTYRAKYLQTLQQQTDTALQQQVSQAQQRLDSIGAQLSQAESQPSSTSQQAEVKRLKAQQTDAINALSTVKQYASTTMASTELTTQQMIRGSEVVSPATPGKRAATKTLVEYTLGGLGAGLVIGMIIVIIGAVTSDRLRRRDDIAYALGAPVRLSVGALRSTRLPNLRGHAAARARDLERFVGHLRNAMPGRSRGTVGLAVVAVDDAPTVAQAVVALAVSSAEQQRRVVVADLSDGAHAARRLGVNGPGIGTVTPGGVPIVVVVPAAEEVAPVGPLRAVPAGHGQVSERLAEACAHADLVLSLVTLRPAVGGENLRTWATEAVAVVTAGRSTATLLQSAGEMIRLAGVQLTSVVVLDADPSDESLGAVVGERETVPYTGA